MLAMYPFFVFETCGCTDIDRHFLSGHDALLHLSFTYVNLMP